MKIALGLEYPLAFRGGVSVLVEALIEGLASKFEVVVISPDTPKSLAASPVVHLIQQHFRWDPDRVTPESARNMADAITNAGVRLAHLHFGGNFGWGSRLIGHSPVPYLARRGVAVCSTIHLVVGLLDGYCGPQRSLVFKLALWPGAWASRVHVLRSLCAEVVVSHFAANRLRRWYWPLRHRFRTIYHSRIFESALPNTNLAREKIVLNVGHIAMRKGQHILAEAFARVAESHPQWKLLLLGDVNETKCEAEIRRVMRSHSLQDRIVMPGPRADALDFMRRAEIFVQPSFFEGLPLALQEAMLSECACVGTDISGNDEIISDGKSGLLVPKRDPSSLARALDRLMHDDYLRRSLQQSARRSVLDKGMSAEQMIHHHVELYERVLRLG